MQKYVVRYLMPSGKKGKILVSACGEDHAREKLENIAWIATGDEEDDPGESWTVLSVKRKGED